jgi:hypothetical protein
VRHRFALTLTTTGLTAFALAGCGGSGSSGSDEAATQSTPSAPSAPPTQPTPSTQPTQAAAPVRLGCHEYCQQAGGYGAGPDDKPPLATVATRGTVTPVNGVVPIDVKCEFRAPCEGAILLTTNQSGSSGEALGRSDLSVPANSSRTLGVPLSAAGQRVLSGGGAVPAAVTVDAGQTLSTLPLDERANWIAVGFASITLTAE